jgi:hypothetical protein
MNGRFPDFAANSSVLPQNRSKFGPIYQEDNHIPQPHLGHSVTNTAYLCNQLFDSTQQNNEWSSSWHYIHPLATQYCQNHQQRLTRGKMSQQGVRQSLACPSRLGQDMLLQRCPAELSQHPPTMLTRSPTHFVTQESRLAPPSSPVLPPIPPQRSLHRDAYAPHRSVGVSPPRRSW